MTVFKGFLTITKRNLGYVFMYIIIFLTITIAVQKSELTDALHYPVHSMLCHYNDHDVIQQSRSPLTNTMYFHFQPEVQPAACARLHSHRTCRLVFMHTASNHIVWKNISGRHKPYILSDQQFYDVSVRTKPGILCLHIYRQRTTDQCSRQCGQPWNVLLVRSLRQYGYPRKKCTENCPVSSGLLVRSCK